MAFDESMAAKDAPDDADDDDKDDTKGSKDDDQDDDKADTKGSPDDDKGDGKDGKDDDDDKPETQDEKYENHFPQNVRVSDVVGKPMIATDDSSLGTVRSVVRTTDGKLKLIVPFGGILGFGRRAVAVPIEVVGSIGTAIVSVDMDRSAYVAAPTWDHRGETILAANDMIRVAITRH